MKVKLHKTQYEVATAESRFKVVCAGRRWGKSVLARMMTLKWATDNPGKTFWIVAPTYQMAKDIFWKDGFLVEVPDSWIVKKNEQELEIILVNGSRIALRSADKPDRLRGVRLGGLVVDEIATMRNWEEIWEGALRPTLTDFQAPALFISTPKGYNHFYELWERGKREPGWKSWRFTTYDNPHIPVEEIEQAKKELDEDAFAQEYLAEFRKFSGLVFKDFRREDHVIEPIELQPNWTYYRGVDFGWVNPTAVVFLAIDDKGRIIVFDEIYQSGLQTPELAQLIKQKSAGMHFTMTFADSAQASDIAELQKYGISIQPVKKKKGEQGEDFIVWSIRKISEKFKNKSLLIFNTCENLIFELENYQYKEVRVGTEVKEIPAKINDHLIDALRYVVVSLPEMVQPDMVDIEAEIEELPEEDFFDEEGFY